MIYSKRSINTEPFSCQLDMIEKTKIEIKNQPPLYNKRFSKRTSYRPQQPLTTAPVVDQKVFAPIITTTSISPANKTPAMFDPFKPVDFSIGLTKDIWGTTTPTSAARTTTTTGRSTVWG
ncbi:uncharacterized protein SPAPADRAFT_63310 [Spathaspora passalidarum NRRL Y-27907]|uniref:Uncharacterized protein n=1 Tax=Spathaspora passalidarum (strain NRRL Y-27907 / 11-Y1) TaxID=619300 RepID=G3AUB3_SPAPN|nr:uncharacterized protein SPAPADRAFT_63310 [Spathaspora passalidarum NRRL Y-27907]EGW30489.1 hypothetical protein SPAPADRAFT_63310 [Spathaspora passalidarum NRRL Y-27907]